MSSGQKAWAEEREEQAFREHCERVRTLSVEDLVGIANDMRTALSKMERESISLPRSGWMAVDTLRSLVQRLC
ncbi:MAG TPA: hypothetical protein PKZ27_11700 [Rhodocyclaceae bacterium]|nr:hypothetical protein [Rhodocyclaceae bacterium]